MDTPIVDFVDRYIQSGVRRLHMPGHKGESLLGFEPWDLTEIPAADSLYEASGIIAQSERNASALFGCPTLYSTEGSSQGIRAMVYLTAMLAAEQGKRARILAARGAHQVFVSATALLDMDVTWLPFGDSYLNGRADPKAVETALANGVYTAVYVTSPDYLGNVSPIEEIAAVCCRFGVPLLVDNAHGAYLRFLTPSRHPMDLGATMCCDSAHKTLPALTGAAYLHIADGAPRLFHDHARAAMAMFGSTSPSYLILQSLDRLNAELAADYPARLAACAAQVAQIRSAWEADGWELGSDEPLKITVRPKSYGYRGDGLAEVLRERGVECEFFDPDHVVLMVTPCNGDLQFLCAAFAAVRRRPSVTQLPPTPCACEAVMRPHDALLAPRETVAVSEALGRILAVPTIGCPPAVPIIMGGERINKATVAALSYYGMTACSVVRR